MKIDIKVEDLPGQSLKQLLVGGATPLLTIMTMEIQIQIEGVVFKLIENLKKEEIILVKGEI